MHFLLDGICNCWDAWTVTFVSKVNTHWNYLSEMIQTLSPHRTSIFDTKQDVFVKHEHVPWPRSFFSLK